MLSHREALRRTFAWPAARRSLIVAAVVGTTLNLINQGPRIVGGHSLVLWQVVLTYLVPFLVASYACYAAFRSSR